jgi:hypothetical protein
MTGGNGPRPPPPPVGGGRSADEFGEFDANRVGDADQCVEEWARVTLLDAAVRREVDPGPSAHVVLGEVVVLAHTADLLPHLAAADDDPFVGRSGSRHPSTLTTP